MKNPFNHQNYPSNRVKRNAFPLSFQYNGTFEYGKIYPVGLIRVPNAGTYKIEPTLALNFMPTVFPVQTRQKAYLHFFYGRDRNFWNEYKDFVHGLKPNLVKPYIDEGVTQARTGNLLDYLGVPTTIVGAFGNSEQTEAIIKDYNFDFPSIYLDLNNSEDYGSVSIYRDAIKSSLVGSFSSLQDADGIQFVCLPLSDMPENFKVNSFSMTIGFYSGVGNYGNFYSTLPTNYVNPSPVEDNKISNLSFLLEVIDDSITIIDDLVFPSDSTVTCDYDFKEGANYYFVYPRWIRGSVSSGSEVSSIAVIPSRTYTTYTYTTFSVRDIDSSTSPYWRSNDTRGKETIKLSAIPCRMYESIYNLYYRNPQNNPYILNGVPEYNIFTPTLDGGVDNNLYQLRYRNWADDFLTTATQTPQQGIAPLVGLTDRGATITLTNEDGSVTRYKTSLDDEGNLTGIETTDSSEPILTQALVDAVTYGISIEDIRNVNKMQKWLELNLRKGYQYKDVIEARWGISISYNELNLPEFIGGFTQEVSMQAVTQTANIDDSVTGQLGWQAGRMYCAKDGREITHYCDEAGYIMVLLSVAPMPNYSQLLPKHWFTRDLLEEYQPEFNHIGFQPITYKEVCPVQAYQESTENNNVLEQTFGYQRPWYEYMSMPDEVHGQFRTTLKDYLINRVFDVKPELSESFLLVDPEQINDVFNVTESDDKILGAINYNIVAKLPISEYATPSLE